jgi:site-specific DNA-cytosine methylase
MIDIREIRHFHLFAGLGGGAKGFNSASARVGNMVGRFRCIGGIDVDAAAMRDFERLTDVRGTVLDLFDRDQYSDFHGSEPPPGWREAGPADIRAAAGDESPHIVFLSAPCKGFSGLLNETRSKTAKYQALNRLTLRGVWLMLEAFADEPPELIVFENVPRIANRGRHLLEQIGDLLRHYGYAVAETTHDCGELGGLAQSRKRFLLVARHIEKVPPFLYEPDKKRLQAVGTVLDRMPLPGATAGGPMHRIPSLQWKTWVRLAFVEAGCDWRSLNKLAVEDGVLRDFLIVPEYRRGYLGVNRWDQTMGTVQGESLPSNGAFSIADPRAPAGSLEYQQYGVCGWQETMGSVINVKSPGQGTFSIADPRRAGEGFGKYMVTRYDEAAGTVISGSTTGQGAYAVADPRPNGIPEHGDHYLTGGHYGVTRWDQSTGAVSSAACHDNGRWSVADPRMPKPSDKLVAVIRALDGTWHRPFTTLELAALQSLIEPEEYLELDGLSDSGWRERIGNAVPPSAAAAIAGVMGTTLLLAWSGETFMLSASPIWVRPVAVALSVVQGGAT